MADETYARDEFDEIAAAGGPVGVHRAPRPWWAFVIAPVVVFLVAGLVAYVLAQVLWSTGGDSEPEPTVSITSTASATSEPSATSSPETSESASPEPEVTPTETEEPAPPVDYDLAVAVLNGTGISGLAGGQADLVSEAGFTSVTAANLSGDAPDGNRVVYAAEDQITSAQEVADALGIDTVEQGTPTTDAAIEVQLVDDPR